jgi:hypothetical protein
MMMLCSLTFVHSQSAKADCGFTLSTSDQAWSFSTDAGAEQSRTLVITNTSGGSLSLKLGISGSDAFTINHSEFTLVNGDTASVVITFHPGQPANVTLTGSLTILKLNTDCHQSLNLTGTVTGTTNGGDILVADPHEFSLGPVALGSDSCKYVTVTNTTHSTVIITGWTRCDNTDFSIVASFDGQDTLLAGATAKFKVCYTPNSAHLQASCSITLSYLELDPLSDGHIVISFSGSVKTSSGGDAILVADPHEFSFGTVDAGTTVCHDVIVTNRSHSAVVVTNWNTCDNKDFSVSPAFDHADTLAAGSSMTFTICYTPHEANLQAGCTLVVHYLTIDPSGDGSITINFGGNSVTNTQHDTSCLHTEQGHNYHDAIVVGGTADHTLYLINNSSNAITVNSATISGTDAGVFSVSSTLPITVPAHTSNTTLMYTFAPTSNSKVEFTATITLALSGDNLGCHSVEGHLIGYVVHHGNTTDSVVRPLFPDEHRTLGIEGNGERTSVTFYFTNNLDVDCTVNKVYLADGTYFTISSTTPSPTPFVLHPGANLMVVVTYTATDNLVHHDHLMIDANHNLQEQDFDLQGVNAAASVPNALPSGVAINVSPNPASNYLTVNMAGVRMADIQVIDLLGNTVTTAKANTTWKWNASNAVAGSYIVRIAGESTSGEQFVASKRIVVSK